MIKEFIEKNKGRTAYLEHEVKGLLKEAGLPVPLGRFIKSKEEISSLPDIKYPLVAKVSSTKITSKSDVQGVRTGLKNWDELYNAVSELLGITHAEGVLVEEMAPDGLEVIVGGVTDRQFGPVVMFGIGGIFVELFKDVAFGLAPISVEDAFRLIKQIRGYPLLEGYRGKPAADINALLKIIVVVSELMGSGLIKELDLNPVALYPEGAIILDAKMTIITS
ncbi:MAG: acetate--CoA ligase family protein [Nitrospirota bacterium]